MPVRERMSGADAAWLHMDRPHNPMIVTTVLRFDEAPDGDLVDHAVLTRLVGRFPRFRQRAADPAVTFAMVAPSWAADPTFRLDSHISRTTLGAVDGGDALDDHIARRASAGLDPDRPLWHAELVEVAGGPAALLLRTHHALADGAALMRVVAALTDPVDPSARRRDRSAARPRHVSDVAAVEREAKVAGKLGARAVRRGATGGRFTAPLSGVKDVARLAPVPIHRLKRAGRATSGTVNDVLLTAVAGALHDHLAGLDDPATDLDVVVPISVREIDGPRGELGNRFGLAFLTLPSATADPVKRQAKVTERMRAIKSSSEPQVTFAALTAMGSVPRAAEQAWIDSFITDAVAVVTNVVGPPHPVALAGTPVRDMALLVPSTGPIGLGISLLSYDGTGVVSVIADRATLADIDPFAASLAHELNRQTDDLV